jgi:hypothetical protein
VVLQGFKINANWAYQERELKKKAFYALKKRKGSPLRWRSKDAQVSMVQVS